MWRTSDEAKRDVVIIIRSRDCKLSGSVALYIFIFLCLSSSMISDVEMVVHCSVITGPPYRCCIKLNPLQFKVITFDLLSVIVLVPFFVCDVRPGGPAAEWVPFKEDSFDT